MTQPARLSGPDIARLLAIAAAYDRRTVGDADMLAWTDAALRERWTFDAACEAIKAHYARYSPAERYLSPGDITQHIADRRVGKGRPPAFRAELPAAPPASAATRARLRTGWRDLR